MQHGFPDFIGIIGVALTLNAYFLLQIEKIKSDGFTYYFLNSMGSLLIIYSLFYAWNISAWVMELCWLAISLAGLWKYFKKRRLKHV